MANTERRKNTKTNYFIVEFRFPYEIRGEEDAKKAAEKAQQEFSDQYGFFPDLWKTRVFEFENSEGSVGPQKEFFFSPTGTTMKEISKNYIPHQEKINEAGEDANIPESTEE